jgi:6-pyruvoyltetrahydropterin/6-carboxytetrahydropterin synthase
METKIKMILVKEFKFDAAHKLKNYQGPCANLHGHTYKLQIALNGPIKENGMIIDFVDLKKIVKEKIISKLDHNYLNKIVQQPTAENLVIWIFDQLKKEFNQKKYQNLKLKWIKLWETKTSYVIHTNESDTKQ